MLNTYNFIFIVFLSIVCLSCADQSSALPTEKAVELGTLSSADTLAFTSGIRAIFEDSKGRLWIGSIEEGVAVHESKTFRYFTVSDGLTDNQIHSIQEDQHGQIWIETLGGICCFDGEKITSYTKSEQGTENTAYPMPENNFTLSDWSANPTDLWFEAGNRSGVFRFDGKALCYLALPSQKVLNPSDNLFAVTDIAKGKNKQLWLATYAGVFGYNGSAFTTITDETLGYDRKKEALHIRSIFADSKGRLWMGNNGIGVLLKEGDEVINFSNKYQLIAPNSHRNGDSSPAGTMEHVFTIAEDHKGNIWFGDRDTGTWKFDGKRCTNFTTKNGLTNAFALAIYEDKHQQLWFGMADGSMYTFNGKAFEKRF